MGAPNRPVRIISEEEAITLYNLFGYISVDRLTFGKADYVLVEGDYAMGGDFTADTFCQLYGTRIGGVIITGDLSVDGIFRNDDVVVFIQGNLRASHVHTSGGHTAVAGSCDVDGVLSTALRGGYFGVFGYIIKARFLFYNPERFSFRSLDPAALTFDNDHNSGQRHTYHHYWSELQALFISETWLLDEDEEFFAIDIDRLIDCMDRGIAVMCR